MDQIQQRVKHYIHLNRRWVVVGLVAFALAIIGGVAGFSLMNDSRAAQEVTNHETVSVSWAEWYPTVEEMADAADLVVHGTVRDEPLGVRSPAAGIIVTRFVIDPVHIPVAHLEGQGSIEGVIVHQTGGVSGDTLIEVDGYPLLQGGEEVVLFLKEIPDGEYVGEFRILAGPEGMFSVVDGMVKARTETRVPDFTQPVPLDEFLEDLREFD